MSQVSSAERQALGNVLQVLSDEAERLAGTPTGRLFEHWAGRLRPVNEALNEADTN